MRASVAQVQVIQALEPTINDEKGFCELFKGGLSNNYAEKEDDSLDVSLSMNMVTSMMNLPQKFVVNVGES